MVDYEYRHKVFNSLQYDMFRICQRAFYEFEILGVNHFESYPDELQLEFNSYQECVDFYNSLIIEYPEYYKESMKILNCIKNKRIRLKKKVIYMLATGKCKFITLTFKDSKLADFDFKSRRRAVKDYISSFNSLYVGNLDFGYEYGREHYHFLLQIDYITNKQLKFWQKNYGFINVQNIGYPDATKLTCYVAKLSNHGTKESTIYKNCNMIVSRNFPPENILSDYYVAFKNKYKG